MSPFNFIEPDISDKQSNQSVKLINDIDELRSCKPNWNDLYLQDPSAQYFLSWNWTLRVCEKQPNKWLILAVKSPENNGRYVAFFPIRIKTRWSESRQIFRSEVRTLGSFYWADYSGFICDNNHELWAIECIAAKLKELCWHRIWLKNFYCTEKRLAHFCQQFSRSVFSIESFQRTNIDTGIDLLVCPCVELTENFDEYLTNQTSKSTRQKIRRYFRKIENSDEFRLEHFSDDSNPEVLDSLFEFWSKKWAKEKGEKTTWLADKYKDILKIGGYNKELFIPVLWHNNKPIGVIGCFVDRIKGELSYFVAGRDESVTSMPIGLILHAYSVRWAISQRFKKYDFLRGNEPFKYSFGAKNNYLLQLEIKTLNNHVLFNKFDKYSLKRIKRKIKNLHGTENAPSALNMLEQLLNHHPNDTALLGEYAKILRRTGNNALALKVFKAVVELEPHDSSLWLGFGLSAFDCQQFETAEFAFRTILKLNDNPSVTSTYFLASSIDAQGKTDHAEKWFGKSSFLQPQNDYERKLQLRIAFQSHIHSKHQ